MKSVVRKMLLLVLLAVTLSTLLVTWKDISGIQKLNGLIVLTGNMYLSVLITGIYFVSVVWVEKAPKIFFCMGLSSLSMLFAIMFHHFEALGRFANKCAGPYLGLLAIIVTTAVYIGVSVKAIPKECYSKEND